MSRARDLGSAFSSSSSLSSDSEVSTAVNAVAVKKGNTASRPASPSAGDLYSNTQTGFTETYTGTTWIPIGIAPSTPTSVVATNSASGRAFNNGRASVAFSAGTVPGTSYTITSDPGGYTATGA
jgi:hypothetical protein